MNVKQIPMTDDEIKILLNLIIQSTPRLEDQPIVISLVERLQMMLAMGG